MQRWLECDKCLGDGRIWVEGSRPDSRDSKWIECRTCHGNGAVFTDPYCDLDEPQMHEADL